MAEPTERDRERAQSFNNFGRAVLGCSLLGAALAGSINPRWDWNVAAIGAFAGIICWALFCIRQGDAT